MGVKNRGLSLLKNTAQGHANCQLKKNLLLISSVTGSIVFEHTKTIMESVLSVLHMRILGPLLNLNKYLLVYYTPTNAMFYCNSLKSLH